MNSPGIQIEGVSHRYGKKIALNEVDLEIRSGTFCALLGLNGAGKSTLFSLLSRLYLCQSGKIRIAGVNLEDNPGQALSQMGIVFQQPTLDLELTVKQNLSYFGGLHGMGGAALHASIGDVLDRLHMQERSGEKVRVLNGGHRRRLEIARALMHKPSVLLLDEPTVGLDTRTRQQITDHVHDMAKSDGLTVLWATHLVDEVMLDDQLVILHEGNIIRNGIARSIKGRKKLAKVFTELTGGIEV